MPPRKKPRKRKRAATPTEVVGWREWVALPELGIGAVKAKVDTGARSSSLHAYDMKRFKRRGVSMIRFKVHPIQRNNRTVVEAEAKVVDLRKVRSSSGAQTLRPVIVTPLKLGGETWEIEITLVRRDAMGFRMLLGRQAVRGHLLVDPGSSFLVSSPPPRAATPPSGAKK
ncbi:MAG: ATP-dependent zinc protease [Candidatus Competibacterales bacterium]|nr:ATP-dependent zinc protease [Candidatus Competibacterales bacterium]